MTDPMHFDARAEVYERSRPPYPDVLWSRLRTLGVLDVGLRVLELGAGSGQATTALVHAGARVTAVEPGPALARRLHERLPQVEVLTGTAEEVPLPERAFDVAVAATAVHWLDLARVLPRLHHALVPDGRFIVWRNVFGEPDVETPFRRRVAEIVSRRVQVVERGRPDELDLQAWVEELSRGGWFVASDVEQWRWSVELDAQRVRDLFSTFSEWTEAEAEDARRAAQDLGGTVVEHCRTWLIVLRAVPGGPPGPGPADSLRR
jgi:SAM-dependent methyltransferase